MNEQKTCTECAEAQDVVTCECEACDCELTCFEGNYDADIVITDEMVETGNLPPEILEFAAEDGSGTNEIPLEIEDGEPTPDDEAQGTGDVEAIEGGEV